MKYVKCYIKTNVKSSLTVMPERHFLFSIPNPVFSQRPGHHCSFQQRQWWISHATLMQWVHKYTPYDHLLSVPEIVRVESEDNAIYGETRFVFV